MPPSSRRPNSLPTLGVALTLPDLDNVPGLGDFIREHNRDVEMQDCIPIEALRGDNWRDLAPRITNALDGHTGRLGMHGPFWGFDLATPDPDVRAVAKARLDAGLEVCRLAAHGREGAFFVVHSPFTTWHWFNRGTVPASADQTIEFTQLCLGEAVKKAEDNGITIVIENIEDKDPVDRVALAAAFASPAVQVSLDTGHAHYAHGATGAPPVDVYVRAAGNALKHVHLQDTDAFADRHWTIGHGTICWRSVFKALGELDEMPRLIIEMNDTADALPSARWLQQQGLAI